MRHLLFILIFLSAIAGKAQEEKKDKRSLHIYMHVIDNLTRQGLDTLTLSVIDAADSSLVAKGITEKSTSFAGKKVMYADVDIPRIGSFLLKFESEGYKTRYVPFEVKKFRRHELARPMGNISMQRLPKEREVILDEVVVKASKVKFYMDGDTLTFNADAFELPEGSMLDALIKKLPGVELKEGGEIKVNGKRVDVLMLNGKNFFDSNRELMLDNLPSYMVKNVQTYERTPEKYQGNAAGETMEREMIMNIKLKRDYATSWMANVELGGGLPMHNNRDQSLTGFSVDKSKRWVGRSSWMRFDDISNIIVYANANNLNDNRIPGQQGDWSPLTQKTGLMDSYNAGIIGQYEKTFNSLLVRYNGSAIGNYSESSNESSERSETFLTAGSTFGRNYNSSRSYDARIDTKHEMWLRTDAVVMGLKEVWGGLTPELSWRKWNNNSQTANATLDSNMADQWGKAWVDSLMSPNAGTLLRRHAINRTLSDKRGNGHELSTGGSAELYFAPAYDDRFFFSFFISDYYKDEKRNDFDHYLLDYPQNTDMSTDRRNRYDTNSLQSNDFNGRAEMSFQTVKDKIIRQQLTLSYQLKASTKETDRSLYLLHQLENFDEPLGNLPSADIMEQVLDRGNSQWANTLNTTHLPSIGYTFSRPIKGGNGIQLIRLNLTAPMSHDRLHLRKGDVDTVARRNATHLTPFITIMHNNYRTRQNIRLYYAMTYTEAPLYNMIDVTDDSNPLNILHGNPNLEATKNHMISLNYSDTWKKTMFNSFCDLSITENAIAMGYIYDIKTGVMTITPDNVNGNWNFDLGAEIDLPLVKADKLRLKLKPTFHYNHSVDLVGTTNGKADGTVSEVSRSVVGSTYWDGLMQLTWRHSDKLELSLKGDIHLQHSTSNRDNFETIDVCDFDYGTTAQLELPWNIQLSTDLTMYSRRGYSSSSMNTNELVWNARLTKRLMKGALLLQLDGLDILGNLSNVRRTINAQGMTETYTNVIPSYCMMRLTYKFGKKAKRN